MSWKDYYGLKKMSEPDYTTDGIYTCPECGRVFHEKILFALHFVDCVVLEKSPTREAPSFSGEMD